MTHDSERNYQERVADWFRSEYGDDSVLTNVYLPKTGRYVDLLVEIPPLSFAIEIENDWEACFKGVGQALLYGAESNSIPVVIVPKGHVEEPERAYLSSFVRIVELDV